MRKQYIEIIVALAIIVICGAGFLGVREYRGQSSLMPVVVLGLMALLSMIWLGQSLWQLRQSQETMRAEGPQLMRFVLFVAGVVLYVICLTYIGFFTATLLMVPLLSAALGYRNFKLTLPVSMAFVAILYAVFVLLLKIPLPPELISRLMGGN